jgi:hypothetical protein
MFGSQRSESFPFNLNYTRVWARSVGGGRAKAMPKRIGSLRYRTRTAMVVSLLLLFTTILIKTESRAESSSIKREDTASFAIPITVTIDTSRQSPSAGQGLGIIATFVNTSQDIVYLNESFIALALPPELASSNNPEFSYVGYFPTEDHTSNQVGYTICLKPKSDYKVLWNYNPSTGPGPSSAGLVPFLRQFFSYLFFSPGDYKISVIAKYWIDPAKPSAVPAPTLLQSVQGPTTAADFTYNVTAQDAIIHVAAPQSVILAGAAIGGIMAFIILPGVRHRSDEFEQTKIASSQRGKFWWMLGFMDGLLGLVGAITLSIIVTILLSRMSESQNLIRITATDLWGAIAIGFISNYAGISILRSILPTPAGGKPASDVGNGKKEATTVDKGPVDDSSRNQEAPIERHYF